MLSRLLPIAPRVRYPVGLVIPRTGTGASTQCLAQMSAAAAAGGAGATAGKRTVKGVVFDMDGTVTVPCIDFALMRRRCGVTQGDILDVINSWDDPKKREAAYAVIAEMEDEALANMKVMPGAQELCRMLDTARVPRGLITRNVLRSVHHFHDQHITRLGLRPFAPAISRECDFAYKPSPEALLHICSTWGISASEAIMVGDSVKDDIVCGNRAGAYTVLLDLNGMNGYRLQQFVGEMRPHAIVHSLSELQELLARECVLVPPPLVHAAIEEASVEPTAANS